MTFAQPKFAPGIALVTLAVAYIGGCGDDHSSRPRYVIVADNSDVRDDTQVSSLDDEDLRGVCAGYAAFVDTEINFDTLAYATCLPPAIVFGGTPQGCQDRLDSCRAGFPPPLQIRAQVQDDAVCLNALRACNGTVAQVEGCVNVNLGLVWDILDRFSCGAINDNSTAEARQIMNTVSVCADLNAHCTRFADVNGLQ